MPVAVCEEFGDEEKEGVVVGDCDDGVTGGRDDK